VVLRCADCGRLRHDLPATACRFEPCRAQAHGETTAMPPGRWRWLGLVRGMDGRWLPVAETSTLEECWDAMMGGWLDGDHLAVPVKGGRAEEGADDDDP
jgi:hypothetical protein